MSRRPVFLTIPPLAVIGDRVLGILSFIGLVALFCLPAVQL